MKTKTLTLLLFTALLTTTTAAQTSSTYTQLETTLINTDPIPLQSGESGDLNFKIRNTGNTAAENVQVTLEDSFPFQIKPDRKTVYNLGTLQPGQEYQISTEVLVNEEATDGSNNFKITVSGNNNDVEITENVPVEVQSQDIELNIANLKTQPQQLMPDTDNNLLTVDVVNNGEKTAENVVLNLELPGFFEKTSSFSTRQALGNLQPGQVKTAQFTFDINQTASKGPVNIEGNIAFSADDSTQQIEEPVNFEIYMEGKPQYRVTETTSNLQTGKQGTLRLTVRNIGGVESSSTRIRVLESSDQPLSYSSSSQYIGTLEPGQSGEAVFEITTEKSATAKDYLVDFEIRGVRNSEVFVEDETVQTTVNKTSQRESNLPLTASLLVALLLASILVYRFRSEIKKAVKN